jgi:hypothetical protein
MVKIVKVRQNFACANDTPQQCSRINADRPEYGLEDGVTLHGVQN